MTTESGAEREKRLRRLAQRGVVRLFNAIGAAQGAPDKADRDEAKRRKLEANGSDAGSTATTTAAMIEASRAGGNVSRRPNVLGGRGKGEACAFNLLWSLTNKADLLCPRNSYSVEFVSCIIPRPDSSWY